MSGQQPPLAFALGRRAGAGSDASSRPVPAASSRCLHRSSPAALAFVTIRATCRLYRRAEGVSREETVLRAADLLRLPVLLSDVATLLESHLRKPCSWCPRPCWAGAWPAVWTRMVPPSPRSLLADGTHTCPRGRGLDQVPTRQLRAPHLVCRAPGGCRTRLSHLPSGKVPPRNRHCPALRDGLAPCDVD